MRLPIRHLAAAWLCGVVSAQAAVNTDPEPLPPPQVDTGPCFSAIASNDDKAILALCGELIGNERTLMADRTRALAARAAVRARSDQADLAIADYDAALRLEPLRPDLLNARGELWRNKGDRPRAIRDFGAAMKLDPQNDAARANYKALAQEIERLGAKMSVQPPPKAPLK